MNVIHSYRLYDLHQQFLHCTGMAHCEKLIECSLVHFPDCSWNPAREWVNHSFLVKLLIQLSFAVTNTSALACFISVIHSFLCEAYFWGWVFQSVQQPFHLSVLPTFRGFSFSILLTPFKNRNQFLKPMCLFLFDVLKHDNICLVCGDLLCGVAAVSTSGAIVVSAALSSRPCGCSCTCVTVFNHPLNVVLFEFWCSSLLPGFWAI